MLAGICYLCWQGSAAMDVALFPLALFGALWLASSFTGLIFLGRWLFEFIVSPTARSTILGADVETDDG